MRRIIFLFISITALGKSQLLTFSELENQVLTAKKHISVLKEKNLKLKEIDSLNKTFEITINAYKDKYPQKGPQEELDILMLFYSLEPVFELTTETVNKDLCQTKEHQIRLNDGRTSDGKVSKNAQLALDILALVCI